MTRKDKLWGGHQAGRNRSELLEEITCFLVRVLRNLVFSATEQG